MTATIAQIAEITAAAHNIAPSKILGVSRSRRFSWARQEAMFAAHQATGKGLSEIGRAFGRDHSTVAHAITQVLDRRADPEVLRRTERIILTALAATPTAIGPSMKDVGRAKIIALLREAMTICEAYDYDELSDEFQSIHRSLTHA